jgi:leader peptidase (prepilin peptidase)/N-methyltransferase
MGGTWPAFIAHCILIAGLVGMLMIDARTFTIPLEVPLTVTIVALVAWPLQALLPLNPRQATFWPIPVTNWPWTLACLGGLAGILLSVLLLRLGKLRRSFSDYEKYLRPDDIFADYPHARREMFIELGFLLPAIALGLAGYFLGKGLVGTSVPPVWMQALGGSLAGYFVGGAAVWTIRILATLAVGREAMGLGDVHLLACVGAVLGWEDPLWAFFIAPFFGVGWVLLSRGIAVLKKGAKRELPYGPHLALATLLVIFARPMINTARGALLPIWNRPVPPRLVTLAPQSPSGPQPAPAPRPPRSSGRARP